MMDDQDLEARLKAYHPAGPPPDLRARVVGPPQASGLSAWAWLPAVAALVLTMLFYWLADNERRMLGAVIAPVPPIDQAIPAPGDRQEPQP